MWKESPLKLVHFEVNWLDTNNVSLSYVHISSHFRVKIFMFFCLPRASFVKFFH